jgi:hypothetical protein
MDEDFSSDQERERAKKPRVGVQIQEKGQFDAAQGVTADGRKQPEWDPGNQGKRNDPSI